MPMIFIGTTVCDFEAIAAHDVGLQVRVVDRRELGESFARIYGHTTTAEDALDVVRLCHFCVTSLRHFGNEKFWHKPNQTQDFALWRVAIAAFRGAAHLDMLRRGVQSPAQSLGLAQSVRRHESIGLTQCCKRLQDYNRLTIARTTSATLSNSTSYSAITACLAPSIATSASSGNASISARVRCAAAFVRGLRRFKCGDAVGVALTPTLPSVDPLISVDRYLSSCVLGERLPLDLRRLLRIGFAIVSAPS